MKERIEGYFRDKIAACRAQEQKLAADGREDEAVFAKISGNVYDIFRTVYRAALEHHAEEADQRDFFFRRLEEISGTWKTACEKAHQHGDVKKACIEQVKLEAAAEIEKIIGQLWEEQA